MATTIRLTTPDELNRIPTPEGNQRWTPSSHRAAYDFIIEALAANGITATPETMVVYRSMKRLVCVLDTDKMIQDGTTLVVAFTNSFDRALPMSAYFGVNSTINSMPTVTLHTLLSLRKSTKNAAKLFRKEVTNGINAMEQYTLHLSGTMDMLSSIPLTDEAAHSLILRSYAGNIISSRHVLPAMRIWDESRSSSQRTALALLHAMLSVIRNKWNTSPYKALQMTARLTKFVVDSMRARYAP